MGLIFHRIPEYYSENVTRKSVNHMLDAHDWCTVVQYPLSELVVQLLEILTVITSPLLLLSCSRAFKLVTFHPVQDVTFMIQ